VVVNSPTACTELTQILSRPSDGCQIIVYVLQSVSDLAPSEIHKDEHTYIAVYVSEQPIRGRLPDFPIRICRGPLLIKGQLSVLMT
jgi:hypothetical protein